MNVLTVLFLGVMLLSGPDDPVGGVAAVDIEAEADEGMKDSRQMDDVKEKSATITSVRSDFDRQSGVVMFEQDVCVTYSKDYVMHSDRLFAFFSGSNELSRIVAIGDVTITNDTRVGTCAMAKFWRRSSEIEMYGGDASAARLFEVTGENDLKGRKIRFWLDSEQVEVLGSDIKVEQQEKGRRL